MANPYFGAVRPFDDTPVRRKPKPKKLRESNIREALDKRVAEYGGETRAVSWLGRRNAPDVLCLFPTYSEGARKMNHYLEYPDSTGAHPFVETKKPGKSATAAQAREHSRMREAGCVVLVITTLEELDQWLPPL